MRTFGFSTMLVATVLIAGSPISANAGVTPGAPAAPDPFTITFDENGSANVSVYGGSSYAEAGYLAADQSGFGGGLVLTYDLPENVGGGGINVLDASGAISDNLYFYNDANGGHMEYLSQAGGGALADTGVHDFGYSPTSEAPNETFSFVAGGGDPASTNFYDGVSGVVPEPASLTLLGVGIAGMAAYSWRRRKSVGSKKV